jgi:hypothetical protein
MFKKKNNIRFIDVNWKILKNDIQMNVIPKKNELLFFNDIYYEVVNVIYDISKIEKQQIIVVLTELKPKVDFKLVNNQIIT